MNLLFFPKKHTTITALLIGLIFLILGLWKLSDYGQNWDEAVHFYRGQAILHYFLTGKKNYQDLPPSKKYYQKDDTIFFSPIGISQSDIFRRSLYADDGEGFNFFLKNYGHPPLSDILAAFFNYIFFQKLGLFNDVDSHHIYSVFVAAILVSVIFWWVTKYYGIFTGFIAALSLSVYPLFLGESRFNIKDIPETVFYSLMIISFSEAIISKKNIWLITSSILFGFALATKFNIIFSVLILAPWLLIYILSVKESLRKYVSLLPSLLLFPIIPIIILYLSWPFLWTSPYNHLLDTLNYYKGMGVSTSFDPRYLTIFHFNTYVIQWVLYSTPIVILIFCLTGFIFLIRNGLKEKNKISILVLIWFILPIARVSMPNAGIYGGVRHIMEYIPAMAILSAYGASYLRKQLIRFFTLVKIPMSNYISSLLLILLFLPIILKMINIHPNESIYFNQIIGGLKGAKEIELLDWGMSLGNPYKQGMRWLNRYAEKDAKIATNFGLGSDLPNIFIRPDIIFNNIYRSTLERKGEYIIGLTHQTGFEDTYFFKYLDRFLIPLYEVKVDNVPILRIWKNDLEHTQKDFLNIYPVPIKPKISIADNSVIIDLQNQFRLAKLWVKFAKTDCTKDSNGSLSISIDNDNWYQLDGDLKVQTFSPKTTYQPDNSFLYYFAGDKVRYISIDYDEPNSCFKDINEVIVSQVSG
ncbi:MAG: glycosyltransferase family 39 protein [Candidatus Gottesmanbacteria bacterium]